MDKNLLSVPRFTPPGIVHSPSLRSRMFNSDRNALGIFSFAIGTQRAEGSLRSLNALHGRESLKTYTGITESGQKSGLTPSHRSMR
jgi:hypothetical protein